MVSAALNTQKSDPPPSRILYHCVGARSFRPLWALEELGLPYALVVLPFPPRVHARHFKQENPLGTIPLYVEGALRITESVAITQYLVERPGVEVGASLAVGKDEGAFGEYLNYLHFGEATLTFPQTLVLRYGKLEPEARRQPQVVKDYADWFLARLRVLEPRLEHHNFMCAGRFTAADISVGYALHLAAQLGLSSGMTPAVTAYFERMQERPGFQAAVRAERAGAISAGIDPEPPAAS
jgi:glutathione S-transferase